MTYVHINAPRPVEVGCMVSHCPTCGRLRRMLFRKYEWYGDTVICAGCGDEWQDGEMSARPFAPGWRRKSIEAARADLASIGVQA